MEACGDTDTYTYTDTDRVLSYQQLQKLSSVSQQDLETLLLTLWRTRKTGLNPSQKSSLQSLLSLSSPPQLHPVLACLRSLIRKCIHDNFTSDDLLKLFPPDLARDLQSNLILLLQKYQDKWKEEASKEQNKLPRNAPLQVIQGVLPSLTSIPSSVIYTSLWLRQDNPIPGYSRNNFGASTPITAGFNVSNAASVPAQSDVVPSDNLGVLPRLKSMTWTLQSKTKSPNNRVAVITLKLQGYSKSPSGETEVKFQLTRDTLEDMLRSMTHINDQLSSLAGSSTKPSQKKQKQ